MGGAERLKKAVVDAIPEPIAERVLPWRRAAFRAAGLSRAMPTDRRLLIGPVNSAGQAFAWARAAERLDEVSAVSFAYRGAHDKIIYPADHSVSTAFFVQNRRWQRAQYRAVERGFTHVLFESGRRLFGSETPVLQEAERLSKRGIRVGLVFHGSDIRLPSVHRERERDSPFRDGAYPEQDRLEATARENRRLVRLSSLPVFVSTLGLLTYVPEATWLPVVVDPERWRAAGRREPMTGPRPIVVHAPSRAGLKGTALIAGAARRLHDEGVIEYREITGVAVADMPEVYGAADIVLDQFSLGDYGVAACEAMASGRIVVSHVDVDVRERVHEHTGLDLPMIQATARELEGVLRAIAADPTGAREMAALGPTFVDAVHSGARSAMALAPFLGITGAASATAS